MCSSDLVLSSPLGVGGDFSASRGPTGPLFVPNMVSGIVLADFVVARSGLIGQPRLRFAIASGAGEIQSREAVSRRTRMSAARGRVLGTRSQHFSVSTQTSSDKPRTPRLIGRGGRSPAMINASAAWEETWENGCPYAKTYGVTHQGCFTRECSAANLVNNHSKCIDVRLLRRT